MANPAPTINQINAFNATQGTTIDFNIIGGTELVRSNRIYIYDLSDNSLICTHLYVSTESIHELPPNTDSSIVYESGKSSADFVNGAQYYAQIQTFTDIAGTEGGSGLSVAKMFWCLVDPSLTISAIPSSISTTSYNVSATYNANTSVVSNIIQQYQFNLYSATGSLLQSSGVVVGNGTQQGTSTAYDISYNFSGLSVGSSYYVVVDVTTTQGMSVSAQSGTFTVSIDTPTLGEATVVNNACDGYISVTSNLSSEYGGSASGEIASFVTNSINNVSSLKVNLEPIQDLHGYDHPWVGGAGKNKLPSRNGTVTNGGLAFSCNGDGVYHISGTSTSTYPQWLIENGTLTLPVGTTFTLSNTVTNAPSGASMYCILYERDTPTGTNLASRTTRGRNSITFTIEHPYQAVVVVAEGNGLTYNNATITPQIEVGSTATTYEPYSNICPISGHDSVDAVVSGKNLLDPSTKTEYSANTWRWHYSDGYVLKKNVAYTFSWGNKGDNPFNIYLYLADFETGSNYNAGNNMTSFTPTEDIKVKFQAYYSGGIPTDAVFQLELGSTATDYEPYNGQTYTTSLGQTVYGGVLDVVTGELVVDRAMVDLGSLNWGYSGGFFRITNLTNLKRPINNSTATSALCTAYNALSWNAISRTDSGSFAISAGSDNPIFCNTNYTDATAFKESVSGVMLCYELATPTTIQLTPHQIQTLVGQNNVWSDAGDVEVTFNLPISNLLVKRQDASDVSGNWLTLYSQPITQASDMDFTFIDFLNQYGKTYKYALVPLLTQTQSGVEVEVEGGYTVSDEVQSIFDGVFIADSTGSQKCKANVGYGNVDMNQAVGSITTIGAKYPIVITNSQNQYHNGSISGTIVPDDYYFNGNLSRIDMVNKRNELEQFLTNKRAKIIKDWNGNIWLAMIMDNVSCTFNNNYGMGIVNFSTNWIEVGDPTNQQDLQATGLIDVGGA